MIKNKKEKLLQDNNSALDFGDSFPIFIELPVEKLSQLELYDYIENGRVYRFGLEIVCVELLNKHK